MPIKRQLFNIAKKTLPGSVKSLMRNYYFNKNKECEESPYSIEVEDSSHYFILPNSENICITEESLFDFEHILLEDHKEFSAFLKLAENSKTFFDIGASRGVFSNIFCKLGKGNESYSFEGSPISCKAIKELSEINKNTDRLEIIEKMVGDRNYTSKFSFEDCGYVQILQNSSQSMIEREVISIDSFFDETCITPDLIKIDVEGFEHEVILGCSNLLINNNLKILLELHLTYLENRDIDPTLILKNLQKYNYKLLDLDFNEISIKDLINTYEPTVHLIAYK